MRPSVQTMLLAALPFVLLVTACGPRGGQGEPGPPTDGIRDEAPLPAEGNITPSPPSCYAFDALGTLACTYSGMIARERQVIGNEASWAVVWDQAMSPLSPRPEVPQVDFSREMVVLAAMGEQTSGGFAIGVKNVAQEGDTLEVTIMETSPGPSCGVTSALTQPFTAVRVARAEREVRFVEQQLTIDCAP
jgi:hypothetical protein